MGGGRGGLFLRSPRPRGGSGHPWHVQGDRHARSHTVWCPRSSSAGCTLPASPGRRGPAAPRGTPFAAGWPVRSALATHGPWDPSSPPPTRSPGLTGRYGVWGGSVAIWGVRRGRGGPPRPRRPVDARFMHRPGGHGGGFPIQKRRFTWRTPVGPVRALPVLIEIYMGFLYFRHTRISYGETSYKTDWEQTTKTREDL